MIRRDGPHTAISRRVGCGVGDGATSAGEMSYFIALTTLFTVRWTLIPDVYISTLSTALT